MGLYMDQNRNLLKKACFRSNFGKRFGAIDSGEPGQGVSRGHIIRKKFENFFYDPLFSLNITRQNMDGPVLV